MMNKAVVEQTGTGQAFKLRRATPADRGALVAMYLSFEPKGAGLGLPPREHPEQWLDALATHPNFLVEAEGRVVGHAALCLDGDSGEVAVFVHQDYRGRGLGKRLLGELINEARRLGLRRVWGMTELANLAMFRLAWSFGFVPGEDPYEFYLDLEEQTLPEAYTRAA